MSVDSASEVNGTTPAVWDDEENLKILADAVRTKLKVRHGVEHDKRVEYFKGDRLITFLLSDQLKLPNKLPKVETKEQAIEIARSLLGAGYYHRSEKLKKGVLKISAKKDFEELGYYTWIYEGPQAMSNLMTFLILATFLVFTCFPIWPHFLKVWLWYVSVTLLSLTTVFLILRFLAFLLIWVVGYEFWFLPNLFDESLSFTDSFKPVYSWEKSPGGQGIYRMALAGGFLAFLWWAYSQPTEFDNLLAAQKQFMHDLYEGNLLSDTAQSDIENIDKVKSYPTLEELLREDELDGLNEEDHADSVIDSLLDDATPEPQDEDDEESGDH